MKRTHADLFLASFLLLCGSQVRSQATCDLQELKSARVVIKPPVPSLALTSMTLKFSSELFPVIPFQAAKPEATNVQCASRISAFYVYVATTSAALDALVRSAALQPDFQAAGVLRQTATKSRSGNTFGCAAVFPAAGLAAPGTTVHCRVAKRITNPPSRDVLVFSSSYTFVVPGGSATSAGPDKIVLVGTNTTLTGTLPTVGNAPYTCYWTLVQGNATIASPNSLSTQVTLPVLGVNTFKLTLTSASGAVTSDQVNVTAIEQR